MAAEEFVAESQKPFYKRAYKTSPNKGKRIFNSIQLNSFTLSRRVAMGGGGGGGWGGPPPPPPPHHLLQQKKLFIV